MFIYIGDLVAIHRKVHLFDIDIPGKIKFKVSLHSSISLETLLNSDLRKVRRLQGGPL